MLTTQIQAIKTGIADVAMDITNSLADTYTLFSSAKNLDISSSSASDITQSVTIHGLTQSYTQISETIKISGQTRVSTINQFFRVFSAELDNLCVGDINIYDKAETTVTSGVPQTKTMSVLTIPAGNTKMFCGVTTLPLGISAKLSSLEIYTDNSVATSVHMQLQSKVGTADFSVVRNIAISTPGSEILTFETPIEFQQMSDIKFVVNAQTGDTASVQVFANFVFEKAIALVQQSKIREFDEFASYVKTNSASVTNAKLVFVDTENKGFETETFDITKIIGSIPVSWAINQFVFSKEYVIRFNNSPLQPRNDRDLIIKSNSQFISCLYKVTVDGPVPGTFYVRPTNRWTFGYMSTAKFSNQPLYSERM
jgi:hypothetical protein